jgi:hypothetical protein
MKKNHNSTGQPVGTITMDLSSFDAQFAAVQIPDQNEVPDGKYRVRVEDVQLIRSPNGSPIMKWDLLILTGQFTGWRIFKNVAISTASLSIVKSDLIALGLKLNKLSDLPLHLQSMLGRTLEVAKRKKGDFVNVYFLKDSRKKSNSQVEDDSRLF